MSDKPSWLPDIIDCLVIDDALIDRLYWCFDNDFEIGRPVFKNRPVWWNRSEIHTPFGYLGYTFWHLISEDKRKSGLREFAQERAERLGWCTAIIRNAEDARIKVWTARHSNGNDRVYLWLEDLDHLVILEIQSRGDRGEVAFLISAYDVKPYRRKSLAKQYQKAQR